MKRNEENKELVKDSFFALIVRGVGSVAALLMSVVITRCLGANEAGYFFLAFTIITVASVITRLGTDDVIIRFSSIHSSKNEWGKVQGALKVMLTWVLVLSSVVGILIGVFSNFIAVHFFKKPALSGPLFWMAFSIPLMALFAGYANALQGIKKVIASVAVQSIILPFIAMACIFIFVPHTSIGVSQIYLGAALITFITAIFLWKRHSSGKAEPYDNKMLWRTSKPLWTQWNLRLCVLWAGQFIAGFYISADKLAELAVAQRTSQLVSFILMAINLISAPRFASFYHQNQLEKLKRYAINTTRLMTLVATPFIIIICIWSSQIMALFGKGFNQGASILIILSLGQFINAISGSVSYLLSMSGHQKDNRNIAIINGIFSLLMCLVLIPIYGALGAAIATALGVASQNFMGVYFVKKRLGYSTLAINFNFLKSK
jgi:O-antigen/teichoic acid export membrane protein